MTDPTINQEILAQLVAARDLVLCEIATCADDDTRRVILESMDLALDMCAGFIQNRLTAAVPLLMLRLQIMIAAVPELKTVLPPPAEARAAQPGLRVLAA